VSIQSSGATAVIIHSAGNYEWKNIIIDAEDGKNYCVSSNNYAATILFSRVLFKRTSWAAHVSAALIVDTYDGCIFIGNSALGSQRLTTYGTIANSLLKHITAITYGSVSVTNSKVASNKFSAFINYGNISILGSKITHSAFGVDTQASTGTVTVLRSIFTHENISTNTPTSIYESGSNATLIARYNKFMGSVDKAAAFISARNISTVEYNIFISSTAGFAWHYATVNGGTGLHKFNNNYSHGNQTSGAQITIGSETSVSDANNNSEFIGNRVIGFKKDNPSTSSATTHGCLLSSGINITIKHNKISHFTLGLVVKTNAQAYTSNGVYSNIIEDCRDGIWVRGIQGLNIFNNTIIHTANTYGEEFYRGIYTDENSAIAGTQNSDNIIIKNNIIVSLANSGYLIGFDAHSALTNQSDYNIFYSSIAKPFLIDTAYYSFVEWQALGYDTHSIMLTSAAQAKALFTDFDNGDYSLAEGSAAIGAGATLAGYTTLLDSATTWGSETTTPVIVTEENTSLCVGAYTI